MAVPADHAPSTSSNATTRKPSRAVALLAKVVATSWFDFDELAQELVVSRQTLQAYLAGEVAMPLDRQLCLALFVIECVPPFARLGRQLQGQVSAALAFNARVTTTHGEPPPSHHW
jgi:hypothetical protein